MSDPAVSPEQIAAVLRSQEGRLAEAKERVAQADARPQAPAKPPPSLLQKIIAMLRATGQDLSRGGVERRAPITGVTTASRVQAQDDATNPK
jgi:hypothetical protein